MIKKVCLLMLLLMLGGLARVEAETYPIGMRADSGVEMELESWFVRCPKVGLMPMTWRVSNRTGNDLSWKVEFSVSGYGNPTVNSVYHIAVPAGLEREMELYVPVGTGRSSGYYNSGLNWLVAGPGVENGRGNIYGGSYSSNATMYIGISDGDGKLGGWGALEKEMRNKKYGMELRGSELNMKKAPEDWRGYTGLGQLWMTEAEWARMAGAKKRALVDWVSMGGDVYVLVKDDGDEYASGLSFPGKMKTQGEYEYGVGRVKLVKWDGKVFPLIEAASTVTKRKRSLEVYLAQYHGGLDVVKSLGELKLNMPLIIGFIVVFGLLIGPVNLFYIADKKRRSRLFWTTPVLSLGGSLLLMGLMVLQDGVGGDGKREVVMVLQPEVRRVSVMQEQVSKTGVLLGKTMKKQEPMLMLPLQVGDKVSQMNESYRHAEDRVMGDWFLSRSIQGQWLQAVRPSRATVEVFSGSEEGVEGRKEVVSSVGVTMQELWVVDEEGEVWVVKDLGTGERKKLEKGKREDLKKFIEDGLKKEVGPLISHAIDEIEGRKGYVLGVSDEVDGVAIETLDNIRWNEQRLIVMGPYESR